MGLYFTLALVFITLGVLSYFGKLLPKNLKTEKEFKFYKYVETFVFGILGLAAIFLALGEIFSDNHNAYLAFNIISLVLIVGSIVGYFLFKYFYLKKDKSHEEDVSSDNKLDTNEEE